MDSTETAELMGVLSNGFDLAFNIFCALIGALGVNLNIWIMAFKSQVKTKEALQKYKDENYLWIRISYFSYIAVILIWFFMGMSIMNVWFFTFDQFSLNIGTIVVGMLSHFMVDKTMYYGEKIIDGVLSKFGGKSVEVKPEETKPEVTQ